jgi:hypothetical protein
MNRLILAVACIGLLGIALSPRARADAWNKRTVLTVNESIQVPNKVLSPGKYVIKLLDSPSDRHIVQIFNGDESHLETTVLAIPNYRLEPSGKTVLTFWETPPGQPKAVRAWFYPGDNFGQEFTYPKSMATQIAAVTRAPVPITEEQPPQEVAQLTPAPPPPPQQEEVAQATPPPPPPVSEQAAAPQPAPEPPLAPAPAELPKTASPYPLIGLAGAFSLGVSALLRAFRSA